MGRAPCTGRLARLTDLEQLRAVGAEGPGDRGRGAALSAPAPGRFRTVAAGRLPHYPPDRWRRGNLNKEGAQERAGWWRPRARAAATRPASADPVAGGADRAAEGHVGQLGRRA